MERKNTSLQAEEIDPNLLAQQRQKLLLVTKFCVPMASGPLISRPHLTTLLAENLKYSLTLISAPAGFGKTTLLAAWERSLDVFLSHSTLG